MKLVINKPYFTTFSKKYQGTYIFEIISKPFQFRWFTDCGEWFIYIHLGNHWLRFSSVGYMRGKDYKPAEERT